MPETMLGLVKTKRGVGNLELREVPVPVVRADDEVLIEVKAAAVCGTDIHIKHDRFPYWPPVILCHEFSGVIREIGPGVTLVKCGDRVVAEPHTKACGKCYLCRTGNIQICPHKRSPGWGIDGAFAKYIVYPEKLLHRIPESLSFEEGACVEPTANVVHDVLERGGIEANDFAVVMGPGPIGLLAAQAAKAGGATHVMIVGTDRDEAMRLPIARKLGIDYVLNAEKLSPVEEVARLTDGRGADVAIECSGAEAAIRQTVDLIRRKGRITVIGMSGKDDVRFPWDKAIFKVADVAFCLSTSYTSWDKAIGLIAAGRIRVKPIISHVEPLTNWEKVFDDIENLRAVKAVLIP